MEILAQNGAGMDRDVRMLLDVLKHCLERIGKGRPPHQTKHVALDRLIKDFLLPVDRVDQWCNAATFTMTLSHVLSLFSFSSQGTVVWKCKGCGVSETVAEAQTTAVVELHAVRGDSRTPLGLGEMIEGLLKEERKRACGACAVAEQPRDREVTYRHLGNVLALSINWPPQTTGGGGEEAPALHAIAIPAEISFASFAWVPTAVLEYDGRSHWWAYVKRGGRLWKCSDTQVAMLEGDMFPSCHPFLVFWVKKGTE